MTCDPLPPSPFAWREEGPRWVLTMHQVPLAQVEPAGHAWVVRTLLHQVATATEPPSRIAVPSLQRGKAWLARWAQCHRDAIAAAVSAAMAVPQRS